MADTETHTSGAKRTRDEAPCPSRRARSEAPHPGARLRRTAAALALAALLLPTSPAHAAERAAPADPARLGQAPLHLDTTVLDDAGLRLRARAAGVSGSGGPTRARSGEVVRVLLSRRYTLETGVLRSWANLLAGLVHGDELEEVTLFLAGPRELRELCGASADGCYAPADDLMVVPGERLSGAPPAEEIAAHEYGHHVANHRSNAPWEALEWGTKRWATGQEICERVRAGDVHPGGEGRRYPLNPGEAFADSYRVLNGGRWAGTFDASFRPRPADLALIREDVLKPWRSNETEVRRGEFRTGGSNVARFAFPIDLDGRLRVSLTGADGLSLDVVLRDGRRRLAESDDGRGPREELRGDLCGIRDLEVEVRRTKGSGDFRLELSRP